MGYTTFSDKPMWWNDHVQFWPSYISRAEEHVHISACPRYRTFSMMVLVVYQIRTSPNTINSHMFAGWIMLDPNLKIFFVASTGQRRRHFSGSIAFGLRPSIDHQAGHASGAKAMPRALVQALLATGFFGGPQGSQVLGFRAVMAMAISYNWLFQSINGVLLVLTTGKGP